MSQIQIPTDNLRAYYPFNGNADDETGNGNDGVLGIGNRQPSLTQDRFGNENSTYHFDGNDYINIGTLPNIEFNDISISCWVNSQSNDKERSIFGSMDNGGMSLLIYLDRYSNGFGDDDIWFFLRDDSQQRLLNNPVGPIGSNNWVHFVFIINDASQSISSIYVNGSKLNDNYMYQENPNNFGNFTNFFTIGSPNLGGFIDNLHGYKGNIDDMRIYDDVLTQSEINALYNETYDATIAGFEADVVDPPVNETVTFTDLSTNDPTSWEWEITPSTFSFVEGTNSSSQNPKVQFNSPGFYDVSLTVTNTYNTNTIIKEDYINCYVPVIVADFDADNTIPYMEEAVNFTDLSTNDPTSWEWVFDPSDVTYVGGTNSTSQNPEVQFNSLGYYTVSLTATNDNSSDTETKTDYINVIIEPPVADFVADNTNPEVGEIVIFTDLSTNPETWEWEITPITFTYIGGTNSTSQNPEVQFNSIDYYTVSLTVTNNSGTDTETKIDYINATIDPPVTNFTADNTNPEVGETVNFTDLSTNDPTEWEWSFYPSDITYVEGTNSSSQNPKVQFNSMNSFTVELTSSNLGGSDTEIKTDYIYVGDILGVDVDANPEEICFGISSQLQSYPVGGTGNYTFSWTSDPSGFTSSEQNPIVQPDETTIYTVEVDDGEEIVYGDVTVTVNPLPEITLDWPESLCNQSEPPVQLVSYPDGGIYIGDFVTSTGVFYPESATIGWNVITYEYEDENGCLNSEQDSIYVDNCVGIFDNKNDNQVQIYPNPNDGEFTIQLSSDFTMIVIYNTKGEFVYEKKIEQINDMKINLKQFPKGMYFIKFVGPKYQTIKKILKNSDDLN